jgi:hypothetical protein
MQRIAVASSDSSATATVAAAFRTRQQASADRVLVEGAHRSETLVRNKDMAAAETLVSQIDLIAEFASPRQKAEWRNHTSKLNKKGLRHRT